MSKKQIIKDYINYKSIGIKTERKLRDLEFYIKLFLNSSKKDLSKFTEKEMVNFFKSISKKYSICSLNGIKANIKNFVKWYFLDWSARFRNLNQLCRQEKSPQTYQPEQMLTKEDIKKLVDKENSIFWKAYFLILFYSGSRPCEICSLKWKQISFEEDGAFIKIFSEKNKDFFEKFIPKDVVFYLEQLKNNKTEWVFPSPFKRNEHISVKGVYFRLKKLSQETFGKHINPYILRHSIATILYNDDAIPDKNDVARQMGHNKNMEKVYSNLSKEKLRNRARKIWIKQPQLTKTEREEMQRQIDKLKQNEQGYLLRLGEIEGNLQKLEFNLRGLMPPMVTAT